MLNNLQLPEARHSHCRPDVHIEEQGRKDKAAGQTNLLLLWELRICKHLCGNQGVGRISFASSIMGLCNAAAISRDLAAKVFATAYDTQMRYAIRFAWKRCSQSCVRKPKGLLNQMCVLTSQLQQSLALARPPVKKEPALTEH